MPHLTVVHLTAEERRELERRVRARTLRAEDVRRARVLLMLDAGHAYAMIQQAVQCDARYVSRWKKRFLEARLGGLYSRHRGRAVAQRTPRTEARILAWTRKPPPDGSTHWSSRKLARQLGISHIRLDPVLPLSPGRAERHGVEYYRHGTLSLYAALDTQTGAVVGKTATRHTSEEFVAFLAHIVVGQPRRRDIHIIVDNLSAPKSKRVQQFLADHPRLHLHFTPTYSSWLNQFELWFSKIEREVIARGVFTSVPDLKRKLMRYIRQSNKTAKPIKWSYTNVSRRITTGKFTVTGY